jgi:hypothetical protein
MKKLLIALVIITALASIMLTSCTQNQMAKEFGGTATLNLPKGQKLVTATWKQTSLWYLTRPMRDGEVAETYDFKEDSSFGLIQGTVTIVESK